MRKEGQGRVPKRSGSQLHAQDFYQRLWEARHRQISFPSWGCWPMSHWLTRWQSYQGKHSLACWAPSYQIKRKESPELSFPDEKMESTPLCCWACVRLGAPAYSPGGLSFPIENRVGLNSLSGPVLMFWHSCNPLTPFWQLGTSILNMVVLF